MAGIAGVRLRSASVAQLLVAGPVPTPGRKTSTSAPATEDTTTPMPSGSWPAWLFVIWHCWQDNTAYDPDQHGALQRLLANNTTPAQAA